MNINILQAQEIDTNILQNVKNSNIFLNNTLLNDTIYYLDSTNIIDKNDVDITTSSEEKKKKSIEKKNSLEEIIKSQSADSLENDLINKKIRLYNNVIIDYGKIHIESGFAEIDMVKKTIFVRGIYDHAGLLTQKPKFKDSEQEFTAETIKYNFETSTGYVTNIITQQGEGFIHGKQVKILEDNTTLAKDGAFTTCDLEHPHFQFRFTKGKIIPKDKIITGLTYLEIEDIPTPLAVPFGIFPLFENGTSGIIIPGYGNSAERGFFLENGGYYWHINDYLDLKALGDIYTRGSWALKPELRYNLRYKFNGKFNFSFAVNKLGIKGTKDYTSRNDFKITWIHNQDPKARPNSKFSANVNFVTSSFNKYNPATTNDYLSNTFNSSIAYQTSFIKNKINFAINLGHSQNTKNQSMTFILPEFSLSVAKINPFKRKKQLGNARWYEKININYAMTGKNEISSIDSLLFKEPVLNKMRNGIKHTFGASFNTNLLKVLNFSVSANYTARWYSKYAQAHYQVDNELPHLVIDQYYGFKSARDFNFNSSIGTTLYGLVQFKKGYLKAIRHVATPNISFTYSPDFGTKFWGNYDYYEDVNGDWVKYSIYNVGGFSSLYGYPADGTSGRLSFSLGNNLEIKVRNKHDTIIGTKKIKLIDNLALSTNYDFAKDSLNLAPLSISGRTSLIKGLDITYSTMLNPYKVNENGKTINEFIWKTEKRLFSPPSQTWSLGFSYSLNPNTFKKKKNSSTLSENYANVDFDYIDWDNPWSLTFNYNFSYIIKNVMKNGDYEKEIVKINAVRVNGNVDITAKWKISYNIAYDIDNLNLSYASLSVHRDLHCWEMSFNWIPFGGQQSWNFTINVKAAMLNSLKYEKKSEDYRNR